MAALLFHDDFQGTPDTCVELPEDDLTSGIKYWAVGRHPDCDTRINNIQVSGMHAIISRRFIKHRHPRKGYYTAYYLEDQDSRNGTYINGKRIDEFDPEPLHPQDKISFGWPEGRAIFLTSCKETALSQAWEQPGWPTYKKKIEPEPVPVAGTAVSAHQPELPDTAPELIAWGVWVLEERFGWFAWVIIAAIGVAAVVILLG
jgi:hypothetical protein